MQNVCKKTSIRCFQSTTYVLLRVECLEGKFHLLHLERVFFDDLEVRTEINLNNNRKPRWRRGFIPYPTTHIERD